MVRRQEDTKNNLIASPQVPPALRQRRAHAYLFEKDNKRVEIGGKLISLTMVLCAEIYSQTHAVLLISSSKQHVVKADSFLRFSLKPSLAVPTKAS